MKTLAVILTLVFATGAVAAPASAAGLSVSPVSPAPDSTVPRGAHTAVSVQTAPWVNCTATIVLPDGGKSQGTTTADSHGVASWPIYTQTPGTRNVRVTCSLRGEQATTTWRYSVQ